MDKIQKIANFFFELNEAKRTPRSGWQRLGIKHSESVAEHSACCAQIAYILALMEGVNAEHAAMLGLFHDIGEIRTGDNNWIASVYSDKKGVEVKAMQAQIKELPLNGELASLLEERVRQTSKEAIIAKDADILDLILQSRVNISIGVKAAQLFIDSNKPNLKTESAKKLLAVIEKTDPEDWWLEIPEIKSLAEKLFFGKKS